MKQDILLGVASTVVPADQTGRSRSPFFMGMAQKANQLGAEFVLFHPDDIDVTQKRLRGYIMHDSSVGQRHGWVKRDVRLPDAIYENVFVHLVMKGMTRPLRNFAARENVPLFNPILPGKNTMSHIVASLPQCALKVPTTRLVTSVKDIADMLAEYETVYVKPTGGYGGRGVLRVSKVGGAVVVDCDRYLELGKMHRRFVGNEWEGFLQRIIARRAHIVQEQIPLLQMGGAKVDFRVVAQRNKSGRWVMVGLVPKVASHNGVVTNLIAGGTRVTVAELRKRIADQIPLQALEKSAICLSEQLSRRYPNLGVIGYDLGADASGRVWFIEANPKPARRLLFPELRRQAGDLAVEFAYYLASR